MGGFSNILQLLTKRINANKLNKKGIELAVNFLVVLIISVVLFAAGVAIIFKRYYHVSTIHPGAYDPCVDTSEKVCLSQDTFSLQPKELKTVNVHIKNVVGVKIVFNVSLKRNLGKDQSNAPHDDNFNLTIVPLHQQLQINNNDEQEIMIGVRNDFGLKRGLYIVDLNVYLPDGQNYDSTHKITVSIP